jgi:conjugal transfer/type IV secretion protein DotA/TraY
MINRSLIKLSIILSLVLSMLMPMVASADNTVQTTAPYKVAEKDYFLGVVLKGFLGDVVKKDATGADDVVASAGNLGEIFRTFNYGVAFFGTLMVTFITVIGVLQSGNDGEFLGRRWSSMWVPFRFATGSALMLPLTSSGYSFVQAIILWVVLQGVGFADSIWSTVVTKMFNQKTAQVWGTIDGAAVARAVVLSEVCSAAVARETSAEPVVEDPVVPKYYEMPSAAIADQGNARVKNIKYLGKWGVEQSVFSWTNVGINDRICGQVSLQITMSDDDIYKDARKDIAEQHMASMKSMASKIRPLAVSYVDAFHNTNLQDPGALIQAHNKLMEQIQPLGDVYRDEIANIADASIQHATNGATYGGQYGPPSTVGATGNAAMMKDLGFVSAGMYYIDMTRVHGAVRQAVTTPPAYTEPDLRGVKGREENIKLIIDAFKSASAPVTSTANENAKNVNKPGANITAPPKIDADIFRDDETAPDGGSFLTNLSNSLAKWIINVLFGVGNSMNGNSGGTAQWSQYAGQNPILEAGSTVYGTGSINNNTSSLMQLKNKGDNILDVAGLLLTTYAVATGFAAAGVFGSIAAPIVGVIPAGVAGGGLGLLAAAMPMIYAIAFAMVAFGFTLSIYLPMVPYVLWIGGIAGYLILIAEALVASSLWAVMLMHPSGEGMTSQHSERGVMLILGLFARPALMLMGLVTGMFMVEPLVQLINDTFTYAMFSVQGGTVSLLFAIFGFCAIYVSLLITAINKCFAMIHLMPDKVLRWIGGGGEQLGETEFEQASRGNLVAVAGGFNSASQSGGKAKEKQQFEKPGGNEGGKTDGKPTKESL